MILSVLLFLGAWVGHTALLVYSLNWWYSHPYDRLLLHAIRFLHGLLVLVGAAVFWWVYGFDPAAVLEQLVLRGERPLRERFGGPNDLVDVFGRDRGAGRVSILSSCEEHPQDPADYQGGHDGHDRKRQPGGHRDRRATARTLERVPDRPVDQTQDEARVQAERADEGRTADPLRLPGRRQQVAGSHAAGEVVGFAADAVSSIIAEGVSKSMTNYNRRAPGLTIEEE